MKYVIDGVVYLIFDTYYYFIIPIREWTYKSMHEWTCAWLGSKQLGEPNRNPHNENPQTEILIRRKTLLYKIKNSKFELFNMWIACCPRHLEISEIMNSIIQTSLDD